MSDTCPMSVHSGSVWHPRTCGKPIKRDGMCGVHAAARDRRNANDAERARRSEERRQKAFRLTDLLGVPVHASWDDRTFYISTESADRLLNGGSGGGSDVPTDL
jgi:hypothetical protein